VKIKYSNPQKAHPWRKVRLISVERWRFIRRRFVGEPKKTKKGRKEDTQNSGKLAIRPDHPRRRIKIKLSMVGGLLCAVKCYLNRLKGYGAVGVENGPSPLLWPLAYTIACRPTTVQAVILACVVLNCCLLGPLFMYR